MESQEIKKRHILYIVTQGEWGGAQRYVFDLVTNLSQNFDVTVAIGETGGKQDLQDKISSWQRTNVSTNINVIGIKHLTRKISLIHDVLAVFEIAKIYKKLKPNIVHLNSSKAGVIGSFAKILCKQPKIVYTVHGWVFNEPLFRLKRKFYFLLEKYSAKLKDKIIVLSQREWNDAVLRINVPKERVEKIGLQIPKVQTIPMLDARNFLSKFATLPSEGTWIGTIANLYPTKGLDILLKSIEKIGDFVKSHHLIFLIIGEGEEREKLEKMIKKADLQNNIFLLGAIENAANYLSAFELFILPSRKEGLPYTLLEAKSAGLPIIATDVGGVSEMLQDFNNKTIVQPDNPGALANTILDFSYKQKTSRMILTQPRCTNNYPQHDSMVSSTRLLYFSLL